jgi:hypothetical protein
MNKLPIRPEVTEVVGHRGNGRWFANFNQLELLPSDSTPPAGAQDNTQQKLDEICARLEKIENLMVSAPMKEKVKKEDTTWYPPVPEGFSEWIEYTGTGMPVPPPPNQSARYF